MLRHSEYRQESEFSGNVCARLREIIHTSKRTHTLTNVVVGKVWAVFHKFRFSEALLETRSSFLCAVKAPLPLQAEAQLTLQLLVDRLFKHLITITAAETDCKYNVQKVQNVHLTLREQYAIRYMAGYVAVKLKKKNTKRQASMLKWQRRGSSL